MIETLIAGTILAGALSAIVMSVATSAHLGTRSLDRLRAAFAADAIIARVGLDIPLKVQSLRGRLPDGSVWSLVMRQYRESGFPEGSDVRLLEVAVSVVPERFQGMAVELRTLKRLGY